jgi:hypothetical protein
MPAPLVFPRSCPYPPNLPTLSNPRPLRATAFPTAVHPARPRPPRPRLSKLWPRTRYSRLLSPLRQPPIHARPFSSSAFSPSPRLSCLPYSNVSFCTHSLPDIIYYQQMYAVEKYENIYYVSSLLSEIPRIRSYSPSSRSTWPASSQENGAAPRPSKGTNLLLHKHISSACRRSKHFIYHFQRHICCLGNYIRSPEIGKETRAPENPEGQPCKNSVNTR